MEVRTRSRKNITSELGGVLIESSVALGIMVVIAVMTLPGLTDSIFVSSCAAQIGIEYGEDYQDHWDGYGCLANATNSGHITVYNFTIDDPETSVLFTPNQ